MARILLGKNGGSGDGGSLWGSDGYGMDFACKNEGKIACNFLAKIA